MKRKKKRTAKNTKMQNRVVVLLAVVGILYFMTGGKLPVGGFEGFPIGWEPLSAPKTETVDDNLLCGGYEVGLPVAVPSGRSKLIHHAGYSVLYSEIAHLPVWVAWTLTPERFEEVVSRYDKFLPDPNLDDPVTTDEYTGSGYDRGHMCPAADNKWSMQAMKESFYLTNICPQNHNLNRGDWRELEEACRTWAEEHGQLHVVCGPIWSSSARKVIGRHDIVVPDAFYKVVLGTKPLQGIAFVCKNESGNRPLKVYARTIDEVERMTGIDFFSALPDSVEDRVEAECNPDAWNLGGAKR